MINFIVVLFKQHKIIIDPANRDLVHHLLIHECDSAAQFDDSNLPDGPYDEIYQELTMCSSNIATGWAVGGDDVRLTTVLKPVHSDSTFWTR